MLNWRIWSRCVMPNKSTRPNKFTRPNVMLHAALAALGWSAQQIAEELGRSKESVHQLCWKHGIKLSPKLGRPKNYVRYARLLKMLAAGVAVQDIAEAWGVTRNSIYGLLYKNGHRMKDARAGRCRAPAPPGGVSLAAPHSLLAAPFSPVSLALSAARGAEIAAVRPMGALARPASGETVR